MTGINDHNSPDLNPADPVAVIRFDDSPACLRKAVDFCRGFDGLKPYSKVLIKPNVCVGRNRHISPFGVVATSRLLDFLVQILKEQGLGKITVAEGSITTAMSNTKTALAYAGMDKIARKHGLDLVDLNRGPFRTVSLENYFFEIAEPIFEADFVINLAVLKNHFQTKVSLSLKNLKGCLSKKSKRDCHQWDLEKCIALYNTVIPTNLNIIDGIYALINGPWIDCGTPRRADLIIAGRDRLHCDVVGSWLLGVDPDEVEHLKEFSRLTGRKDFPPRVSIAGEKIDRVKLQDRYEPQDLFAEIFRRADIKGLRIPDPGRSICSGCFGHLMIALLLFCQDNPNLELDQVEIISGREAKPTAKADHILLYGDCAVENNADCQKQERLIRLEGCPPTFFRTYSTLLKNFLSREKAAGQLAQAISLGSAAKEFSFFDHLKPPAFDLNHF